MPIYCLNFVFTSFLAVKWEPLLLSDAKAHLDTDGVSLHVVKVWVVGSSCVEELPP